MPTKGIFRFITLARNIKNYYSYFALKRNRYRKDYQFLTRPNSVNIVVTKDSYLVFKEIFMSDVYEIDKLVKLLPPNPVIVDIGANVGFFDVLLLSKLKTALIYAYEPVPSNMQRIQQIISANESLKANYHPYAFAVTGTPQEQVRMYLGDPEKNHVDASVIHGFREGNTHNITVPCITLKQIFDVHSFEKIDLFKIDCEGSEYDIIYNTPPEFIQKIQYMIMEIHELDSDKNNLAGMESYIKSLGYQTSTSRINKQCFILRAHK